MKRIKLYSLVSLLFMLGSSVLWAKDVNGFLRQDGTSIVNNDGNVLLRGIGPGGWMLQEGYMFGPINVGGTQHEIRATLEELTDKATTDAFYDNWLKNYFTREDVDSVASWGYNSIRVPLHYNLFTLPVEDEELAGEITWLTRGFEMVDSLLAQCEDNDLYLILDMHAAPGGQGKNAEISDYDPSKPSLWESEANKTKFVALWYKLAERYKDSEHIGGYDLLNETNWWDNFHNNQPLVDLFKRTIDTIRTVDNNHIIILEGNSWANDFTGFDGIGEYDNNLAFGPHKYWTRNNQGAADWLNGLKNQYGVPVWLGETGENSNTWFTEMIELMESNNIGWATWAHKQMDIDDPMGIEAEKWSVISDYMNNGGTQPTFAEAKAAMNQMSESIKTENCHYRPDVVFAQIGLPQGEKRKPYAIHNLPGTIFATEYDMGKQGGAWYDLDYQDLHGEADEGYTAWNQGYSFRNDGVDIQKCFDHYTNNYHVGWTEKGEWMRYTLNEVEGGVYDITIRVAATQVGKINIRIDNFLISPEAHIETPNTGGYQSWWDVKIEGVEIPAGAKLMTIFIMEGGFNLNYVKFDLRSTGIEETNYNSSLNTQLFQSGEQLLISLTNKSTKPERIDSIEVFNLNGCQVDYISAFTLCNETRTFTRNISDKGLYIVRINQEQASHNYKVMIA